MSERIVTLNVGGILYTTTIGTLTHYPNSMLATMFGGTVPLSHDKDGNIFIDRDGKTFRYVLNFLRYRELTLPENNAECRLLEVEADFYQIEPLIKWLKERLWTYNYIEVVYNSHLTGDIVEIHGMEHTLNKLKLTQKYNLQAMGHYRVVSINQCLPACQPSRKVDPQVLRKDLRSLGWALHDSRMDSVYNPVNWTTKLFYREKWYQHS